MKVEDFKTVFQGGAVRAWLDWAQVQDGSFCLDETYTRSKDILGSLTTVWYSTPDGEQGDWRNPRDRLLRVHEARSGLTSWPDDREQRVATFKTRFAAEAEPIQLVLPAYAVGDEQYLLLDGNHRAAAAYEQNSEVRLLLLALRGPIRGDILPDLNHFEQ